ncbi:ABC transporter permease [Nocardioides psychrotolerans]|uniref:ABC transporter permease n=1 Tax=Nocardioides psychrotolerans TaxID=1005945 RepID=UPI0031378E23
MIATIFSHQVLALRRQRVLLVLLGAMLLSTALAGALGWSSQRTIIRVFDEATRQLAATGAPAPPNPFLLKPHLSLLSNMVVYIPLVGALFAVILGHLTIADEESAGLGRLLFARSMSRAQYTAGKILSLAAVLAGLLVASLLVSLAALLLVNHGISAGELGRLTLFYALSWAYLVPFALIGMITVLLTTSRSLALLTGMGAWLVITFAVPQFTSGLRPTQSLNPIIEPIGLSQAFFQATAKAQPLSVVEQYKAASGVILDTTPHEALTDTLLRILPLLGFAAILLVAAFALVRTHDFSRSASHE